MQNVSQPGGNPHRTVTSSRAPRTLEFPSLPAVWARSRGGFRDWPLALWLSRALCDCRRSCGRSSRPGAAALRAGRGARVVAHPQRHRHHRDARHHRQRHRADTRRQDRRGRHQRLDARGRRRLRRDRQVRVAGHHRRALAHRQRRHQRGQRLGRSMTGIEDVLDPSDINIYRALAGGTTAANILHGSANAIGGKTLVIKLRSGKTRPRT